MLLLPQKKILSVRAAVHSLNAKMAFASALNPTMGMDIIAEVSDTPRNSASDSTLSFYGVYRRRRAKGFASIMSLALRTMILGKLGLDRKSVV